VQAALCTKEVAAAMGATYSTKVVDAFKQKGTPKPTVLFEVGVDDFEDLLLQLKAFFSKHRRVSRALVGADLASKDLKMSAKQRRRSLSNDDTAVMEGEKHEMMPVRDSWLPQADAENELQVPKRERERSRLNQLNES
jgi:hypothetical protein